MKKKRGGVENLTHDLDVKRTKAQFTKKKLTTVSRLLLTNGRLQGQIDVPLGNPEAETNNDGDRSNITDNDRFIVEVSSSSEIERELISDFNDIINKVRKIIFKHEFCALENLENILKPVKLAVEVLCRQDANLIKAEATLRFMIKKLEASELAFYHASCDDETFHLPGKNLLRKEIKDFVIRMQFSLLNSYDNNDDEEVVQAVQ
ncbi:hypothetical protein ILUMI_05781, partial [Ignelater luminosus]